MFPLTEATSLMEEKPPKHSLASFFLSGGLFLPMTTCWQSPDPPLHIHLPAEVKGEGENHKRKKIESELLGNPWPSSFV